MKLIRFWFVLILALLFPNQAAAQLDLEHWFAPIYVESIGEITSLDVYLSTPHETPFAIKIVNGLNQEIFQGTLSKNQPLQIAVQPNEILLSKYAGLQVSTKGLHLIGEKSFFSSFRVNFNRGRDTELITSKGKTALGTHFFSSNPPYQSNTKNSLINHQTSFIATKDHTKIKISGYDPRIIFSDGKQYPNGVEINLNKGESYAFVARKNDKPADIPQYEYGYFDTFIGSEITSNYPIVVSNGGFNGNHFLEGYGKIMLDQTLPVKNIGKSYYIKKGFTDLDKQVEAGLLVATENNTKITVNGKKNILLQQGEFKLLTDSYFENNGMLIEADKPVYFNQFIGGNNGSGRLEIYAFNTPAMALTFPLDTNLPNEIDFINDVQSINSYSLDARLHVLTNGNQLFVNNSTTPSSAGPNAIGNTNWKLYEIHNTNKNVSLKSDGSIILGIIGGTEDLTSSRNGSFAGFYTGFCNDPKIKINGNCIEEGVTLSLTNTDFETFQWQLNGLDIPHATESTFQPISSGTYTCKIGYSGFFYTTPTVTIINCPYSVTEINLGTICNTLKYQPKFSEPNVNLKIKNWEIITRPQYSKSNVLEEDLVLEPYNTYSGIDRIVIKIMSTTGFYEIQKLNFELLSNSKASFKNLIEATLQNGEYYYDLNLSIENSANEYIKFYPTQENAQNRTNEVQNQDKFQSNQQFIYAVSSTASGCSKISKIELVKPVLDYSITIPNFFSPNGDGNNDFLDLEILNKKQNLLIYIVDRFGKIVYSFPNKNKDLKWNGKTENGISLPTNAYWLMVKYEENQKSLTKQQWIFLKNR